MGLWHLIRVYLWEHALIDAVELRNQFNGLKTLIDQRPTMDHVMEAILANSAGNVNSFEPLTIFASNPPTQLEVQELINQLNDLLDAMKR